MRNVANKVAGLLAPALSFALLLAAVDAQERSPEALVACTAEVTPAVIESGQEAVRVEARLSTRIGQVEGFEPEEGSGLELADPADIRQETAQEGESEEKEPRTISTAREDRTKVVLWLSTENAVAGTHQVTLEGQHQDCRARIRISADAADSPPGERGR